MRVYHGGSEMNGSPRGPLFTATDESVAGAYAQEHGPRGRVHGYDFTPANLASPSDVEAAAQAVGFPITSGAHGMILNNQPAVIAELQRRGFDSARIPEVVPGPGNEDRQTESIVIFDPSRLRPAPVAPPPAAPIADTPHGSLPDPGPLADGETYVSTARGDRVRTRFEVVDASHLKPAEGGLQNRDRTRGSTDLQVQEIVSRFDPSRLGDSAEADRGAPIVGEDGVVESGNGRVMALNRIYDAHPEQAGAYRSFIEAQGHSTDGMERPVLIRRRVSALDEGQRRQFVVDANRSAILDLSPTERARSDAGLLDGDMLALYRGGDVSSAANRDFVRAFQGRLPATEQGGLIDSNNALSQAGVSRVEAALMARAYENPDVLEKLLEARDNNIRSIGGAMLDNSGAWSNLRAAVAAGDVGKEYDVTERLVEAARLVSDARNAGTKIGDLLSQTGMFGNIDPVTEQFIRAFYDPGLRRAVGRDAIGDLLAGYVRRASEQTTAPRLIEAEGTTPEDILRTLLDERAVAPTGDLFPPPPAPGPMTQDEIDEIKAMYVDPRFDTEAEAQAHADKFNAGNPGRYWRVMPVGTTGKFAAVESKPPAKTQRIAAERSGRARSPAGMAADIGAPVPRSNLTEALRPPKSSGLDEDQGALDYSVGRQTPGPASPYDPAFMEKSFTNRASIYDTAAIAAGHDPVKFRLLAPAKQIAELARVMDEAFGVKVTVKPGMQARLAIDQMLDAYQNLQGMAFILGLPTKAIGLGGGLSLELRKAARFLGAYSSGEHKIILPGRSNSFAHEWGHGFDYHLLRMSSGPGKGLSGAIRRRGGQMTDGALPQSRDVSEAFVDLLNVMFFERAEQAALILRLEAKIAASRAPATQARLQQQIARIKAGASQARAGRTAFYRNAKAMDGPGEEGASTYWASPTEMLARSFEAYVSHRAEAEGFTTEFIGKSDAAYLSDADERFAKTFPKGNERALIFAAYDVLFDRVGAADRARVVDENVGATEGLQCCGDDLGDRIVLFHGLAGFHEPVGERSFSDALAHRGHLDIHDVSRPV